MLYIILFVLIALFFVQFFQLREAKHKFSGKTRYQVVRLQKDAIAAENFDRIIKRDKSKIVVGGFGLAENQVVMSKAVKRETELSVVKLTIKSDALVSATAVLNQQDAAGCLLDRDSMYQLFGTTRVEGQWLCYDDKEYQVRGLVDSSAAVMFIQSGEQTTMLHSLVVDCKKELYRNEFYNTSLNAFPLANEGYYIADYYSFLHWIETPNKWSDFNFWKRYFKQVKKRYEHMLYDNKDVIEWEWYRIFRERMKIQFVLIGNFLLIMYIIIMLGKAHRNNNKKLVKCD